MGASTASVRLRFARITSIEADRVADLLDEVARDLTTRHGPGPWSRGQAAHGLLTTMDGGGQVWCAYHGRTPVATWTLSPRKPWSIDPRFFSPEVTRPWFLTDMAVASAMQRRGVGRQCVQRAIEAARAAGADALRLDAYDAPAGAGPFYLRCGFRQVGRASYRGTPHVYFEYLVPPATS